MTSRADPRLHTYVLVALGGLVGTAIYGRAELAAIAAPFAVLAVVGLSDRRPPIAAVTTVIPDRVVEGDLFEGEIHIERAGPAEIDVIVSALRGVKAAEPLGWSLAADAAPAALPFRLVATAWGRHHIGEVHVRARRPWALFTWDVVVPIEPRLRVLPSAPRLDELLHPTEPHAAAGSHTAARVRGAGTDFAELRPYQPGDRLRDVSWAATARTGTPWVSVHHPERTGTVLLVLDSLLDGSAVAPAAIADAARAAWAIAAVHLQAQDRVGVHAIGSAPAWLPPTSGRRARWLLLDELLTVGTVAEDPRTRRPEVRAVVPSDALIIGLTSLQSSRFVRELVHHRRHGRSTVALVIDPTALLTPTANSVEHAARRLWRAELRVERYTLRHAGIPSAMVAPGGDTVRAVRSLQQQTTRRRQVAT